MKVKRIKKRKVKMQFLSVFLDKTKVPSGEKLMISPEMEGYVT